MCMLVDGSEKYSSEVINMSFMNPLNWFGKKEEAITPAPYSPGASAPVSPGGPYESAAGRRRRHRKKGGQTMKAGQGMKAGRRHRRKHSRRA
jgi:hypothetical protein